MVIRARYPVLLVLLAAIVVGVCLPGVAQEKAKLDAKTLRAGLRTTEIEDRGFIDRVVEQMEEGELPESMVRSTFLWAKKKPRRKFQYFKYGLILRAKRIGKKI